MISYTKAVVCALLIVVAPAILAAADGYWFTRAEMPTARQEILPGEVNGEIYVIGGWLDGTSITDLVEVFDPTTNTWSTAPPLPHDLHHCAVVSVEGLLYVVGGYINTTWPAWLATDQLLAYDPITEVWSTRESMIVGRGEHSAVVYDNKIYVTGGNDINGDVTDVVEVYDPATDSWTQLASMLTARHHHASAAVDTLIYVVGGRQGFWGTPYTTIARMEAYAPASDTWYALADLPNPRGGLSAAGIDDKLYIFGGEIPGLFEETEEYDPETATWRLMTPMLTPRHGTAAVVVEDTVFIIGGGNTAGISPDVVNEGFVLGTCVDSDHDGFGDAGHPENTCPLDNCLWPYNPDQIDSDSDGYGDLCEACPDDPDKIIPGVCGCGVPDIDTDDDTVPDCIDVCPDFDDLADADQDDVPDGCDNCPDEYNPDQADQNQNDIGDVCDGCCVGRVGDANNIGGDEPTVGDVSVMIDAKFMAGTCLGIIECLQEADINQSGAFDPTCDDITIGDISTLIDYLFITGSSLGLADCL